MLEGIMTADKEVRAQLAHMSDKQANDAMLAQAAIGEPKDCPCAPGK